MYRGFSALLVLIASVVSGSSGELKYKKVACVETVYETEIKKVPEVKEVVKYDRCGKPYRTYEVCYKEVAVKVAKKVEVVKNVKVCD